MRYVEHLDPGAYLDELPRLTGFAALGAMQDDRRFGQDERHRARRLWRAHRGRAPGKPSDGAAARTAKHHRT